MSVIYMSFKSIRIYAPIKNNAYEFHSISFFYNRKNSNSINLSSATENRRKSWICMHMSLCHCKWQFICRGVKENWTACIIGGSFFVLLVYSFRFLAHSLGLSFYLNILKRGWLIMRSRDVGTFEIHTKISSLSAFMFRWFANRPYEASSYNQLYWNWNHSSKRIYVYETRSLYSIHKSAIITTTPQP